MYTARIVRDYAHAAELGARRQRDGRWWLDGVLFMSWRTVRDGGLRGHTLDGIADPDQLLTDEVLAEVMPTMAVTGGRVSR